MNETKTILAKGLRTILVLCALSFFTCCVVKAILGSDSTAITIAAILLFITSAVAEGTLIKKLDLKRKCTIRLYVLYGNENTLYNRCYSSKC